MAPIGQPIGQWPARWPPPDGVFQQGTPDDSLRFAPRPRGHRCCSTDVGVLTHMPHVRLPAESSSAVVAGADPHSHGSSLNCQQCKGPLECVDQNRRSGTWLGSFMCPNCRSEYFYAYRWGRLLRRPS